MATAPLTPQTILTPHAIATGAMEVQRRLLEAAIGANKKQGLRKALTASLGQEVVEMVKAIAPPLVLELGAHQAWFSSTTKAALPASRVLAFEANPEVHARYQARVTDTKVEYLNHAVSDQAGPVTLTVPSKENRDSIKTMGSLLHHVDAVTEKTLSVEAVRLDDYLGDDADRANVIWMDVEGAIGMVLRGAERTLAHCELLYAEIEPQQLWKGQMIDLEVFEYLARFGLVPVLRDVQRKRRGYNALFLRPERLKDQKIQAAVDRFAATMAAQPDDAKSDPSDAAGPKSRKKAATSAGGPEAREQRKAIRRASAATERQGRIDERKRNRASKATTASGTDAQDN